VDALFLRAVIEPYPKKRNKTKGGPVDQPQSNIAIITTKRGGDWSEYPKILVPEKAAINVIMTSD